MHFRQFYIGCLAHASYLIGDGGEAVVVDPSRDIQMYLDEAEASGLRITWVLETHLHADFVSGHRELAARTAATIGVGARAEATYPHRPLRDGDSISVGGMTIRVAETPGHTPESLSFLIYERSGDAPWGVLTGDTLFVGDVGRVDILSSRLPVQELAGLMYDSLHQKLLVLPDETRVYPAHGAGSLCGRNLGKETWSTIGRERAMNAALRPMSREAFVAEVTRDVPETPLYYLHSRDLNKAGPALDAERPLPPLVSPRECAAKVEAGGLVLDTRSLDAFAECHPVGAIHVSLDGQYASWVGTLVSPEQPLLLVAERDRLEEAVLRLARVGYERVDAVLEGDTGSWEAAGLRTRKLDRLSHRSWTAEDRRILDVRRQREWNDFHIPGATHLPLAELPERLADLDRDTAWVTVCGSGYRSSIAASLLKRADFARVSNGVGGMDAWRAAGLPLMTGDAA
ncbi:MAG TPA: rhodanese-like domain-containing protein [Gemmatimonadales bacterium]|nr:rhodanese-like domain-containing protein [Gemmatimonadales bacterium]